LTKEKGQDSTSIAFSPSSFLSLLSLLLHLDIPTLLLSAWIAQLGHSEMDAQVIERSLFVLNTEFEIRSKEAIGHTISPVVQFLSLLPAYIVHAQHGITTSLLQQLLGVQIETPSMTK
jgi:hypothetical protein